MSGSWLAVAFAGALGGATITRLLTAHGLAQLGRTDKAGSRLLVVSALAGALTGAAVIVIAHRSGVWGLAPALALRGAALVAAATCDAVTQRIPTPLVRHATAATCVLLLVGLSWARDWPSLLLSAVGSVAAGLTMLFCWKFAGAGFGDVRLATLGGLGLGRATPGSLALGLTALVAVTATQAGVALARGGNRKTMIPYGPAIAVGFLVAAVH